MILNAPIFIISLLKLGKDFFLRAIIGTISFSLFVDWFDKFNPITNDGFLACIYGGILVGLGSAIILKSSASTGGTELVSNILKKYFPHLKIGYSNMVMDTIIITANMIVFKQVEIGLYSAIAIFLYSKMIDLVFEGVNFTKLLIIISKESNEISKRIGEEVNRGATRIIWQRYVYRNR